MKREEIVQKIRENNHSKVKLAFTDVDGVLRGKTIHKDKFLDTLENGIGVCDVVFGWDINDKCYDNVAFTGWHTAYPDVKASYDTSTLRFVPWDNQLPLLLIDFDKGDGTGLDVCPRTLLKKISSQARDMGFLAMFSEEFEWFNFLATPNSLAHDNYSNLQPLSPGMFGYSMLRPSQYNDYFNDLFDRMAQFDVPLEGLHTETGPGVYEAAIQYDSVVRAADKAMLFKNGVKEIAYRHGIVASFMAKWNENLPGCSGHIHQSLWDKNQMVNAFSEGDEGEMNPLMESYLAGLLYCMPHVMPMYAPTINSYKRLREGAWAPTTISWGKENRTTAVRTIHGAKNATRFELRLPGSDANPYLAMAASLASGLYGIRNNLKLNIPETIGNAYANPNLERLPANLWDATQRMKHSEVAKQLFGEGFVNHFCATREWEWREFALAVTNWELKRYFEIV